MHSQFSLRMQIGCSEWLDEENDRSIDPAAWILDAGAGELSSNLNLTHVRRDDSAV